MKRHFVLIESLLGLSLPMLPQRGGHVGESAHDDPRGHLDRPIEHRHFNFSISETEV